MARRHAWPRVITAKGRLRYFLFSTCKPFHYLLLGRYRQFRLPHRAHAHEKEGRAEALSVHLPIKPGGTFVYAHFPQTLFQVFVRNFVGLHGLDEQQRSHLLPACKNLRLSDWRQRRYVGLLHSSVLNKVTISLLNIRISQIRLILVQFRPCSPLLQVFYVSEKWSMPTSTKHHAGHYTARSSLNQSFSTDSNGLLRLGSYTCSHQLGFKAC